MNKKILKFKNENEVELWEKIEKLEKKFDSNFEQIFNVLKQIITQRQKFTYTKRKVC